MVSGAESTVAFSIQSEQISDGAGSPDIGKIYPVRHRVVRPTAGRLFDQGEPEIGGAMYTATTSDVLAVLPGLSGELRARLGAAFHLLTCAGFTPTISGDGISTPKKVTWAPEPAGASWKYLYAVMKHGAEGDYKFIDGRVRRLAIRSRPRQPVILEYDAAFVDTKDFGGTIEADDYATHRLLHGSKPDAGLEITLLGQSTNVFNTDFMVDNTLDEEGQPVGSHLLDDVPPTAQIVTIGLSVMLTESLRKTFEWGANNATAAGTVIASGAFSYTLSTQGNLGAAPYNRKGYLKVACTNADLYLAAPIDVIPARRTYLPLVARCKSGLTLEMVNGTDCAAYTDTTLGADA